MSYYSLAKEYDREILLIERKQPMKGLYADGVISVKNDLTDSEKNCVLAEELGHHFTSFGDITDVGKLKNMKQEVLARKWAFEKLFPLQFFIDAYNDGKLNMDDLLELHDVTENFLKDCIECYKKKYGAFYQVGQYTIQFIPYLDVYKSTERRF